MYRNPILKNLDEEDIENLRPDTRIFELSKTNSFLKQMLEENRAFYEKVATVVAAADQEVAEDVEEYDQLLNLHAADKARHSQKRKDDFRAIAHKRAVHTCRKGSGNWNPRPWWDKADEDGCFRKPVLNCRNSGQVHTNAQQNRWSKYAPSSKKNSWKKEYSAREIELANLFEKIDAKDEERYLQKSADFTKFLQEQMDADNKADVLLDEFEKLCYENRCKKEWLMWHDYCVPYADINHPGVVYLVDPEVIKDFVDHMEENGAAWYVCTNAHDNWEIKHVVDVRTHRNPGLVFG